MTQGGTHVSTYGLNMGYCLKMVDYRSIDIHIHMLICVFLCIYGLTFYVDKIYIKFSTPFLGV